MNPNTPDEEVLEWLSTSVTRISNRYPDIKFLAHKDTFAYAMQFCSLLD